MLNDKCKILCTIPLTIQTLSYIGIISFQTKFCFSGFACLWRAVGVNKEHVQSVFPRANAIIWQPDERHHGSECHVTWRKEAVGKLKSDLATSLDVSEHHPWFHYGTVCKSWLNLSEGMVFISAWHSTGRLLSCRDDSAENSPQPDGAFNSYWQRPCSPPYLAVLLCWKAEVLYFCHHHVEPPCAEK